MSGKFRQLDNICCPRYTKKEYAQPYNGAFDFWVTKWLNCRLWLRMHNQLLAKIYAVEKSVKFVSGPRGV